MPGRTGGLNEIVCNQTTEGLYGAGMTACGNCPLPAGIFKADSANLYCSRLINGFVSLIRLSDRNFYHLEDD